MSDLKRDSSFRGAGHLARLVLVPAPEQRSQPLRLKAISSLPPFSGTAATDQTVDKGLLHVAF